MTTPRTACPRCGDRSLYREADARGGHLCCLSCGWSADDIAVWLPATKRGTGPLHAGEPL